MKYAVIALQGKQYVVSQGDRFVVDRLSLPEGEKFEIADVLFLVNEKDVSIGTPLITGAKVELTARKHLRGAKIRVAVFKAKSRYRKVRGHRQDQTEVEVTSIV